MAGAGVAVRVGNLVLSHSARLQQVVYAGPRDLMSRVTRHLAHTRCCPRVPDICRVVGVARRLSPHSIQVLDALASQRGEWCHGYELMRSTGMQSGSLYPILMRLVERGWLEATWEPDPPVGRPRRHLYRLSGEGVRARAALQLGGGSSTRASRLGPVTP